MRQVTDGGQPYFFPMGSPFFVFDLTGHMNVISLSDLRKFHICLSFFPYSLDQTFSFSQNHKCDVTHITDAVHCSFQNNRCSFLCFQQIF